MFNDQPVSAARRKYLKAKKRDKWLIQLFRVLIFAVVVALWEICTRNGMLDPFIFSSPARIIKTVGSLFATGNLLTHIAYTLFETVLGFLIGTGLGVLIAVILWWCPRAAKVIDPYLVILNSLPKIALGPVLIVWIGTGIPAIVTIAVLVSVIVSIASISTGFAAVPEEKLTLMRSFGATKLQMLHMVVLPANVPAIVSALKLSVGLSWVGVIVGEFLISRAGLGYLIVYGGQVFKLDIVMSSVVILCTLAGVMYYLVSLMERRVTRRRLQKKGGAPKRK